MKKKRNEDMCPFFLKKTVEKTRRIRIIISG
jgi:hypothetical protein